MTPKDQRIAIAKACGWKDVTGTKTHKLKSKEFYIRDGGIWYSLVGGNIPDYLNDLNAMHETEKMLEDWAKIEYYHRIADQFDDCGEPTENLFNIANATAAQRAEAFLKTLNLWTDD